MGPGMFDGLGPVLIVGIFAIWLMTAFVPVALFFGVAWLLEPRIGLAVWDATYAISGLWTAGALVLGVWVWAGGPK